jgi:hypothetical protein
LKVAGAVEAQTYRLLGKMISPSVQQLVDCVYLYDGSEGGREDTGTLFKLNQHLKYWYYISVYVLPLKSLQIYAERSSKLKQLSSKIFKKVNLKENFPKF